VYFKDYGSVIQNTNTWKSQSYNSTLVNYRRKDYHCIPKLDIYLSCVNKAEFEVDQQMEPWNFAIMDRNKEA